MIRSKESPIGLDKIGFQVNIFRITIATDKRGYPHKNICCGYSLEAPLRGASNEYPQHMVLWRNKKNISIFLLKKSILSRAMH